MQLTTVSQEHPFENKEENIDVDQEIIDQSSHILVGQVNNVQSQWNDDKTMIYSYVEITVEKYLKGVSHNEKVVVKVLGGEVGDIGFGISSEPRFSKGEKVKVFLKRDSNDEFTIAGGRKGKITLQSVTSASEGFSYAGIHWNESDIPVEYYISTTVPSSWISPVQQSFQTWEDVEYSKMSYDHMGNTTIGSLEKQDNSNVVSYGYIDGSGGVLAYCAYWYWNITKLLVEFDIVFDSSENWSSTPSCPPNSLDVQNVGTHEVGHTLVLHDLYDPSDSEETMYGYASLGETKKRTLHSGDVAGIRYIYGNIRVPDDYPTIQAAINAANPGDTIFVSAGTYYEHVIVNKTSVSLVGENKSNTIIDANLTSGLTHAVIKITSSNVTVSGFTLRNCSNGDGITIQFGGDIIVRGNIVTSNEGRGVHIDHAGNPESISIVDNIISSNTAYGIYILASNNVVHRNLIVNNSIGIRLHENWTYNTLSENTISNNGFGIYRYQGGTHGNFVYHNNFINNTQQVDGELGSNDTWDNGYPSGGNYWSDYNGTDSDGDGIGDTPYVIDENNTDNYPLMTPWSLHDIAITSVSTSASEAYTTWINPLKVNVTVKNEGDYTETFNVTVYYNNDSIGTSTITLNSTVLTTLTFNWSLSGVSVGTYTISANVSIVSFEGITIDNIKVDGTVKIKHPGDVNGDGFIGGYDATMIGIHWWSPSGGNPNYSPLADFDGDGFVGGFDSTILAIYWWTNVPKP